MYLEINSKKFGHPVSFSRPGVGYIFADLSKGQNRPGTLGKQICDRGCLTGNTISYRGEDSNVFEKICRRWWRQYIRDYYIANN